MGLLYITADTIGTPTGGGLVTAQELRALRELSAQLLVERRDVSVATVGVYSRDNLGSAAPEPWKWDEQAAARLFPGMTFSEGSPGPDARLAHFYSGSFPTTVRALKSAGCKVVYTIAAHDRDVSRREHEKLGWPFPFPHLTEEKLWQKYIDGYRHADVIICPSTVAATTVRHYGPDFADKDIRVIPHGCELPNEVKSLPTSFVVGYMGSLGADKGVRYLLEAWKKLDYRDGSLLILAGKDSTSGLAKSLVATYGGGNIHLAGWQREVGDFYNTISLYIQPSATEGFGLEVLEAMAHGRPVLCSDGAGAADLVPNPSYRFPACDVDALIDKIQRMRVFLKPPFELTPPSAYDFSAACRDRAEDCTWDKVRKMYQDVWTEVLSG